MDPRCCQFQPALVVAKVDAFKVFKAEGPKEKDGVIGSGIVQVNEHIQSVALVNLALGWLGGLAGWPELSLQRLLGLIFAPCAWLIGVPMQDCQAVGGLLGTRTVLNELIAYFDMGRMKDALSPKAYALATIAMCSFANISSIGIQLGGIGTLVPERRGELASLGVKMLVISTLANALSAAIAGVMMG